MFKKEKRMVIATVMKKAVLMLFQSHVYSFGGKFFLQKKGGPIGLRSTCSIARIAMLDWDRKFLELAKRNGVTFAESMRYMDDLRVWMFGVRLGWRWTDGGLYYSSEWRNEEQEAGMTGLQKTVEILHGMMNVVCDFLTMTMETEDEFGGKLPTLDL